ncbi:hypothetical protein [Caenimonas sp. SL110]|uniref:hypothetical protein n=1 Tax=Caenimonas sp. SL110 TaxID=1450524 RepID=UPI0006549ED0|nr:hypothetical protein [Caenimonas sp. SL110]
MSAINGSSPVGVPNPGTQGMVRQDVSASTLSWRGDEDLGVGKDFEVPQSTSFRPLRKPDSLELFAAVRSGLAIVSDGSLKNPDKFI